MARSTSSERGFSLVETVISIGLLTAVTIGVAQLFAVATAASFTAKVGTSTAMLATQKMEQLRGLTWGFGDETTAGLPVTDVTTNLATDPHPSNNGRGLGPSPDASLAQNTPGYVGFLDGDEKRIGTGANPPALTSCVRRWSI